MRWPASAMSYGGRIYRLPTLGKHTSGGASGLWLMPRATESGEYGTAFSKRMGDRGLDCNGSLSAEAKRWAWPTPNSRDFRSPDLPGSGNYERKMELGYTIDLNSTAAAWATITASAGEKNGGSHRGRADTADSQAKLWATARANDFKSGSQPNPAEDALNGQAVRWGTPCSRDHHPSGKNNRNAKSVITDAENWADSQQSHHPDSTEPAGNESSPWGSMLNPRFGEWLLGWPLGLTELGSLETEWITAARKRRRSRSSGARKRKA